MDRDRERGAISLGHNAAREIRDFGVDIPPGVLVRRHPFPRGIRNRRPDLIRRIDERLPEEIGRDQVRGIRAKPDFRAVLDGDPRCALDPGDAGMAAREGHRSPVVEVVPRRDERAQRRRPDDDAGWGGQSWRRRCHHIEDLHRASRQVLPRAQTRLIRQRTLWPRMQLVGLQPRFARREDERCVFADPVGVEHDLPDAAKRQQPVDGVPAGAVEPVIERNDVGGVMRRLRRNIKG